MVPSDRKPDPPRAPAFTGARIDRAPERRRDPGWIANLLEEPTSVTVAASADGVLVGPSGTAALLRRPIAAADGGAVVDPQSAILLGVEDGAALFALDLEDLDPGARRPTTDEGELVSLRDAGALLPPAEAGLAAYVSALLNWHRRDRFCANCGSPTRIVEGGYSRRCPNCRAAHFPRTDPSVIMLVEHDGRVLLGRRRGWPQPRYSILAGFVSPGETLEEAVVREVREEAGIEARDPRYVTSQPWPFPLSLMLGFTARADGGQPRARDGELEDVRWVTLEEVRAALAQRGELRLPPPISIARLLIDGWVARVSAGA